MNAPHWLQAPRRPGFGAGIVDFQAYMQALPSFASSWNDIQAQLTQEGAGLNQVVAAQTSFTNAYEQLSSQFGAVGDDAITGAHAFVAMGQTVVGAASTVAGLIQTAESGSAPAITQAFTGVMVSLAIATGAVSAGIGAAIVAGVGLILSALGSLGLFGGGGGTQICGATVSPPPDLVVGCMPIWVTGAADPNSPPVRQQPGTFGWRSFPVEGVDTGWFTAAPPYEPYVGGGMGTVTWKGLSGEYYGVGVRAVDYAFPNYARVASDVAGGDFQKAFFAAWKGNAEYALNGLKPQPDAQVLVHMLRLWNKSHAGPTIPMSPLDGSYLGTLISQGVQSLQANDTGMTDGTTLLVNSGAVLNPAIVAPLVHRVIALHIPGGAIQSSAPTPAASTGLSTGAKVAVGGVAVTGAALLGAVAFGIVKGQAVDLVLKHAWKHVRSWF